MPPHEPPPNIIIVMADDLGYGDIGCFGGTHIATPHIDQLANRGVRLTDFHSNGAVCTPTRAAIYTGRYQQRADMEDVIGVNEFERGMDPGENQSLVHHLRETGYATALFGKWHLGFNPKFNPTAHGFDEFRGFLSGNIDYHSHVDNAGRPDWWHNLEPIEEKGYSTDLINRNTVSFIRENKDRPFFIFTSHEAPHWPYQGRNDPPDRVVGSRDHHYQGSRLDKWGAYREMVEVMDEGMGMILDTLDELDLSRRTLILLISDNGPTEDVGSSGGLRGFKGLLYEGGHRVPGVAAWEGRIAPGTTHDSTIFSMDLLPTALNLAGYDGPLRYPLDGIDVASALLDGHSLPERDTFLRNTRKHKGETVKQASARRGDWKWIRINEEEALYNLREDLAEAHNRIDEHPEKAHALRSAFEAWAKAVDRDTERVRTAGQTSE